MSEEQKIDKAKFPVKTMVAGWWLLICGIAIPITVIALTVAFPGSDEQEFQQIVPILIVISIIIGFFYMLPGIFLLLVKKWAWIAAVIMLSIEFISYLCYLPKHYQHSFIDAIPSPFLLVPLILLIIDRKKYLRWCDYRVKQE